MRDQRGRGLYIVLEKRYTAVALGCQTYATFMNTQTKNKMRQAVTMLLGTGVLLSSLNSCSGLSDSVLTKMQGTGIGALGGAAAGTGLGAAASSIAGGDSKDVKKAMVIGAVAGAVVGGVIGNRWGASIVKKKETYAKTEDYINDNIKQVDRRLSQASKLNSQLSKQIASIQKSGQKMSKDQKSEMVQTLKTNQGLIRTDIKNAQVALKDPEATAAQRAKLQAKVNSLQAQYNALTQNISQFNRVG